MITPEVSLTQTKEFLVNFPLVPVSLLTSPPPPAGVGRLVALHPKWPSLLEAVVQRYLWQPQRRCRRALRQPPEQLCCHPGVPKTHNCHHHGVSLVAVDRSRPVRCCCCFPVLKWGGSSGVLGATKVNYNYGRQIFQKNVSIPLTTEKWKVKGDEERIGEFRTLFLILMSFWT